MTGKLIRSRDVIFFEDKTLSHDAYAKLLDRDTPLQIPSFTEIDENESSSQERLDIRMPRPAYLPPAEQPQRQPKHEYLIPPPVLKPQNPESESDSDDESRPTTPSENEAHSHPPTQSPSPPNDPQEEEEEVDIGIQPQAPAALPAPTKTRSGRQIQQTERGRVAMEALKPKARKAPQARHIHTSQISNGIYIEPKSYNDALTYSDADNWLKAMEEELKSHCENGTWTIVP